jgi:transposase-like protein
MSSQAIEDIRPQITRLNQFFPSLPRPSTLNSPPPRSFPEMNAQGEWMLDLKVVEENLVMVKDRHCPICHKWLVKNGTNQKVDYDPETRDPFLFFLQRYRCPDHGEIEINYSEISPKYAKFSPELQQGVRLAFSIGNSPSNIQKICIALRLQLIPLTTIKSWIYPMKTELRPLLYPKDMPCSGSLAYDEVHLKMEGKKGYLLSSVDNRTKLVVRSEYSDSLDKQAVKKHFMEIKLGQNVVITSVVHDGATFYGTVFKDRSLKHIKQGTCHTHFKRGVRTKLYEAVGLGKKVKEDLPRGAFRLLRMLYWTINSKTEFKFLIRLEACRSLACTLGNPKLLPIIDWIESHQELLLNHLSCPFLVKTTNGIESIHNEIEVYRVFKVGMKTELGVEFVADSRIFMHNLRATYRFQPQIEQERNYLGRLKEQFGDGPEIRSLWRSQAQFEQKMEMYRMNLEQLWDEHFPKKAKILFKALWGIDH